MAQTGCSVSANLFGVLYLEMTFIMPSYKEQYEANYKTCTDTCTCMHALARARAHTHTPFCHLVCPLVYCHHLKTIILWMVMQWNVKRDGKCQSEAFGGRWFLLFQKDALPGSHGGLLVQQ